jgi:hypothetical protein
LLDNFHIFLTTNTLDMKKFVLSVLYAAAFSATAQTVFWSEDFGTGCNQGTSASSYTGPNGAWTVSSTGTNDPYANLWFVSATEAFTGSNSCGDGCGNNSALTDATLHLGNAAIPAIGLAADNGATYNTGGLCQSFAICVITNTRAESPVIDCSGATNITLTFAYLEGGDGSIDDGTVWYFDGAQWSQLANPPKTSTQCAPQGYWETFSIVLPASAENNPNVKIGFNWMNNDDGTGTDPSFAIDSIRISAGAITSIASNDLKNEVKVINAGTDIVIECSKPYNVVAIHDITGRSIAFNLEGNRLSLASSQSIYFLEIEVNGERMIKKIQAGR